MPLPILAASALTSAVGGVAKTGLGIGQIAHGKKLEEQNIRPDYDIQNEYLQNRNLGLSMAQQGLTDTSKDYYTDQATRGLSAGIDATLQGGGNANAVAGLYDQYGQSLEGLASKDSQLQTDNIRYAVERNNELAGQKTMKWTLDKFNKYQEIAQAAAAEKTAGIQNLFGGLDQAAGAGAAYSQAKAYEDMLKVKKKPEEEQKPFNEYIPPPPPPPTPPTAYDATIEAEKQLAGQDQAAVMNFISNFNKSDKPISMRDLGEWAKYMFKPGERKN